MPAVEPPSWLPALQALRTEHPAAHPYTLALLLEVQTGVRITGLTAARWLQQAQAAQREGL